MQYGTLLSSIDSPMLHICYLTGLFKEEIYKQTQTCPLRRTKLVVGLKLEKSGTHTQSTESIGNTLDIFALVLGEAYLR